MSIKLWIQPETNINKQTNNNNNNNKTEKKKKKKNTSYFILGKVNVHESRPCEYTQFFFNPETLLI